MKNKKIIAVASAMVVIALATVTPAMAYFTDSRDAKGTATVYLGEHEITPHEKVEGLVKTITVENTGDYDVFVRVKAMCGSMYTITLDKDSSTGWSEAGGYYVYSEKLAVNQTSNELKLNIAVKEGAEAEDFNVIIVQEACRAVKNSDGKYVASWDEKVMKQDEFNAKFSKITLSTDNAATGIDSDSTTNNEGGNE